MLDAAASQPTHTGFARTAARVPLRIGELSRRVGVSTGTLRAWERRYELLKPCRTASGYRLYTAEDEARVRALIRYRSEGVATAEAARLASEDPHLAGETGYGTATAGHAAPSQAGARVAGRAASSEEGVGASAPAPLRDPVQGNARERLAESLGAFDEGTANAIFDQAIAELTTTGLIESLVLPVLRDLGERWQRGEASPAQEHFATNLIRGRLLGLGRDWGSGSGPLAMLACPSGERHDLGLLSFGLILRQRGWRIVFFGQDTPTFAIADTAAVLKPNAVVLAGVDPRKLRACAQALVEIAASGDLYLGGAAASRRLAERLGATLLEGEPSHAVKTLDPDSRNRAAA